MAIKYRIPEAIDRTGCFQKIREPPPDSMGTSYKQHTSNIIASEIYFSIKRRKKMNNERLAYFHYVLCHMDRMIIRLFHMIGLIFLKKNLAAVESLQRANEKVQKYLADVYVHIEARILICQIKLGDWIEFNCFDKVYRDFVEKKRQSLLDDINKIDRQLIEHLRDREVSGLPNKGFPAEKQMEQAVLETYYSYLKGDDAYLQKAFSLFLKKKMEEMAENGADCSKVEAYLERRSRNSSYEEYMACISRPMDICLPQLWVAFFKSGAGYEDVIPEEKPNVAYFRVDADIPGFIFEKPYTHEYSCEEFHTRFMHEWDTTHYNPFYDDCSDPVDYADYDMKLADRPGNAYLYYLSAVSRFKILRQRLEANANKGCEKEE